MITIGLTGSIAAGKSEVARLLAARGARVVDADLEAHQTYAPGQPGHAMLTRAFGPGILAPDGSIDRRRLGATVFADAGRLATLSSIIWPLTRQRIERLKTEALTDGVAIFVIEAPLLVEAGWLDLVDELWFVRAGPEVTLERLLRRGHTEPEARSRMASRPAIRQAEAAATAVIDNSGTLEELEHHIDQRWLMLHGESI